MRIEASGIEKWYFRSGRGSNRFYAVKNADLALDGGRLAVLTGRSGSGKTTLMHMMSGLLTPDSGRITADGQDMYAMNDAALSVLRNQRFGMMPQGGDVIPELTVMENIMLARGIFMKESDPAYVEAEKYAEELLDKMSISHLSGAFARELSGGERRRVCAVRALAGRPEVIFADEPTSDLDDENMRAVMSLLREAADGGAAVMIVTHDMDALDYANVRIRMDEGTLATA